MVFNTRKMRRHVNMEDKKTDFTHTLYSISSSLEQIDFRIATKNLFHDTKYAKMLFLHQIPNIIKALERIADGIEEQNRILDKTKQQS